MAATASATARARPDVAGQNLASDVAGVLRPLAGRYRSLRRRAHPDPNRDPVANLIGSAVAELLARAGNDRAALIAALEQQSRKIPLAQVVAGRVELDAGQFESAARRLHRVVAGDVEDLFAQRLLLLAEARRADGQTEVDQWLETRFCERPFTTVETLENGDVLSCCRAWLPTPFGNANTTSVKAIWNSPAARAIRQSILDGSFAYCSRCYCPRISDRTLPSRDSERVRAFRHDMENHTTWLRRGPVRVLLSHDASCNLSCPSCRTRLLIAGSKEQARLDALLEAAVMPLLREARTVKITGSGDPFGSKHFRDVLDRLRAPEFANLMLELQTNGILLDESAWTRFELDRRVDSIWISLDAATPETYARIRRGGDFDRLMANLAFVADKRRQGRFGYLRLDYVVQAGNFREIPAFVEIARSFGADAVSLQRIRNWGTFDRARFAAEDIADPSHPEFPALLEVLSDPRLKDARIQWGNLRPLVTRARLRQQPGRSIPRIPAPDGLLVVHGGRCGSTALAQLFARARPEFHVDGEIFTPTRYRPEAAPSLIDHLVQRVARARPRPYQVEVKTIDADRLNLDWEAFLEAARSLGIRKAVLLERRNLLRRLISGKRAAVSGVYHVDASDIAPPERVRIHLDPEEILVSFEEQTAGLHRARAALGNWAPLELVFEEDIAPDPHRAVERVCVHLGFAVPPRQAVSLRPTTPEPLSVLIVNYGEVSAALEGSPYAWMLESRR